MTPDQDLARDIVSCRAVVAESAAFPHWFGETSCCRYLDNHLIKHCGRIKVNAPFEISRQNPSGSYFLACDQGQGQFLHDDCWIDLKAGQACLLPPNTFSSLRVPEKCTWSYSWIRFHQAFGKLPEHSFAQPLLGEFSSKVLRLALDGLFEESSFSSPSKTDLYHWIEIINNQVSRFYSDQTLDSRLKAIWEAASSDLSRNWTLEALAEIGHLGIEQFRRLNQKQLHKSPIKYLVGLRMRKAACLLLESDEKIAAIAARVGYENGFHFSNVFQRYFGKRPSVYRDSSKGTSHQNDSVFAAELS